MNFIYRNDYGLHSFQSSIKFVLLRRLKSMDASELQWYHSSINYGRVMSASCNLF